MQRFYGSMQKIFKYILGCVLLVLAFSNARASEAGFDLIDINTGHVSFQQTRSHGCQQLSDRSQHKNSPTADQKHSKKYRSGKHYSSTLFFSLSDDNSILIHYPDLAFTPSLPAQYRYIFYREINPPPPKSC